MVQYKPQNAPKLAQHSPPDGPTWAASWAHIGPRWANIAPRWANIAASWANLALRCAYYRPCGWAATTTTSTSTSTTTTSTTTTTTTTAAAAILFPQFFFKIRPHRFGGEGVLIGGNSYTKCSITFVNSSRYISFSWGGQKRFRTETRIRWCFRDFSRIFGCLSARGY